MALKDSKHLHRVGYIQFHPVLLELFEVTAKKPTNQKKKPHQKKNFLYRTIEEAA